MSNAKNFFSEAERNRIVDAIREAEQNTSGEIRVHIENKTGKQDALHRAEELFMTLGMDDTELHNGVLIYLAVKSHAFAIVGGKGIDEKVPEGFWDNVRDTMQTQFREGKFTEGLVQGIKLAGEELQHDFPYLEDDKNELPDDISFEE